MVWSFKVAVKTQHHKQMNIHPNHLSDKARTLAPKKVGISSKHPLIKKTVTQQDSSLHSCYHSRRNTYHSMLPGSIPSTIHGYQTRYHSRNLRRSCSSRVGTVYGPSCLTWSSFAMLCDHYNS